MRFKVQVDGAEYDVEATADGRMSIGDETFETKTGRPGEDRRMVHVGGKGYEIRVIENCADTGNLVLEIAGERVPLTVSGVARSAASATVVAGRVAETPAGSAETSTPVDVKHGIWAPVPGKIVNVLVQVGDVVEEGATVVVLEAMKMENELHAPTKGTVTAVLVKKGDQAEKGQLLVAFE